MATGIYAAAPATGTVISLFTSNAVFMPLTGDSWRLTLLIFGSIAVIAALAWSLLARDPVMPVDSVNERAGTSSLSRFLSVGSIGTVQIMLVMAIGIFLYNHGTSNWLPSLLHREGISKSDAGVLASLPTIFGVIAALGATRFVGQGKGREFKLLSGIFAIGAIASVLVLQTHGVLQILALVLLGFGLNTSAPLMMILLMSMSRVGPRNMGIAGGLWFTFGEIGGVLGPTIVGVMSDTAGLASGFYLLAAVSCVLVVMAQVLRVSYQRDVARQPGPRTLVLDTR
jgi:cyanate permease